MTGEEFVEKVREIKEISSVEWIVIGDDALNADEIRVKVTADNGEYDLHFGNPALHTDAESMLRECWMERVSFILLLNKMMELQGKSARFNVECGLDITELVNFAIENTKNNP